MSDVDLVRKRSRSSSPGADSPVATKKQQHLPENSHSTLSNLSSSHDHTDDDTTKSTLPTTASDSILTDATEVNTDTTTSTTTADQDLVLPLASNPDTDTATPMVLDSVVPSSSSTLDQLPSIPLPPSSTTNESTVAAAAAAAAAEAAALATTISMRALIVTQDASIIIGKGGKNVNEIREKSGSKINITEAVPGNPERVMVIAGQLDAVSKAFGLIVRRINDEPFDVPSVPGSRAVTIRFIIPNARMGSVIGKAGSKIKEIQEASGARLQASEALLPGSTERVLSVSGVADAIHIAVYYIGTILQEHPLSNPTSSSNDPNRSGGSSYRPAGGAGGGGGYQGGGGGDYGARPPRAPAPSAVPIPGQTTQQIFIPNELVGSIIGKAGSKINEIRGISQCQIKICEPGEGSPGANPAERLVTITGAPYNIQTAVTLLYERLEQEKLKQQSG